MAETQNPDRVVLTNMTSLEELALPYRPEELARVVTIAYARNAPLGFSHQVMQFQLRENEKLDFTFFVDQESGVPVSDDASKILDAMTASSRTAHNIASGAPPEVQLLWPGVLLMRTRITSLKYSYKRFSSFNGKPTWFSVGVTLEETPQKRMWAEDIRAKGLFRL